LTSKISQILRETTTPQIYGAQIKFDDDENLKGKCAIGVLACESGVPELKLGIDKTYANYSQILGAYGLRDEDIYPHLLYNDALNKKHGEFGWNFEFNNMSISAIIIILNDSHHFTFKEIADFLEVTFDL
jgi:hypothetical protein